MHHSGSSMIAAPSPTFTTLDVARAASGDRAEAKRVLSAILPVIRVRVTRVLWRYRSLSRKRDLSQEADDLTQDVLAYLFENEGRVLRSWVPERGLGFVDFIDFVTARTAAGVLKSGARTPWRDDPTAPDDIAAEPASDVSPADLVVSRQFSERLFLELRAELSPLGARLFQSLFVDERDVEQICREHSMSREAVYAWRSRLARRVRELASELENRTFARETARTAS